MHIPDEPPIGNLVAYEYLWLSLEATKKIIASVTLAYAIGMSHKPPAFPKRRSRFPGS